VGQTFHNKNKPNIVALIPSDVVASGFQYDENIGGRKKIVQLSTTGYFRILRYHSDLYSWLNFNE
jgi:hypothetical protein